MAAKKPTQRRRHWTRSSFGYATELPPCEGSKLHRFKHWDSPIKWLGQIDTDRNDDLHINAHIYKVEIRQKEYALKVFMPFDTSEIKDQWEEVCEKSFPKDEFAYHMNPFFAECRAYGRLKEENPAKAAANAIVAPCHGFLYLSQVDEEKLCADGLNLETNNLGSKTYPRHPTPAIVKDHVNSDQNVTEENAPGILRGICALFDYKIYTQDIYLGNFVGGKLVDFGTAMTEPHCVVDAMPPDELKITRFADFAMFDDMLNINGIDIEFMSYPHLDQVMEINGTALDLHDTVVNNKRVTRSRRKHLGIKLVNVADERKVKKKPKPDGKQPSIEKNTAKVKKSRPETGNKKRTKSKKKGTRRKRL